MKTAAIFIKSNSREDAYGFHPIWSDGKGDTLAQLPFSLEEGFESIDAEGANGATDEGLQFSHSFVGLDLEGAQFARAHLGGFDFSRSILRMADFSGADLAFAHFNGVDATFASFSMGKLSGVMAHESDFCRADLRAADIRDADFAGSDFEHALFLEADLRGANLSNCDLRGARLAGALIDSSTVLPISIDEAVSRGMLFRPNREAIYE